VTDDLAAEPIPSRSADPLPGVVDPHPPASAEPIPPVTAEPIPHWPGEFVSLGDHQVFVRSTVSDIPQPVTPQPVNPELANPELANPELVIPEPDIPQPVIPEPDSTKLEYPGVNGSAPEPALCVHGLEGSSRNWTDLMDLLRPRLACDALDLPGFGDSPPRPDGRFSIAALAQTVIALIERRGRGPVHLIGNSLGGAICVKVAASRPELIRTLTLISPALPDPRPRLELVQFPLISLPRVGTRLLRKYQALPPQNRVADVITNCYSDPGLFAQVRFATEVAELSRRDSLGYAAAALVGSIRSLTAETLRVGRRSAWRDAARITAPSLVIFGGHDRLVDPRLAGRAAHAFAGARIVVLPRTGHVAHMEHPGAVAAEIGVLLATASGGVLGRTREFPLAPAG
jgi:pimeloyl-ACP methyl ester carboxylesterase